MNKEKYINDLKEIKDLMNKSSKFISLSGWSGIGIGIIALIASYIAHKLVYNNVDKPYQADWAIIEDLILLAVITLFFSLLLGFIFTYNKSKRIGQKIWTDQTKILLWNLCIPLAIGGTLCIIFLLKGLFAYIAPLTLIFYGLALINASKYTLSEIKNLGIANCILGLIGMQYIGYGLLLWAIGFGVLHIVYGILMKVKHG